MSAQAHDHDVFVRALETAYRETRRHSPQGLDETEDMLRGKLEPSGVTLPADITRALAFAIVTGRDL